MLWRAILAVTMSALVAQAAVAQSPAETASAAGPRLSGLTAAEAAALVEQLGDLQRRLRSGEQVVFTLLSGAPASWPMTRMAPRESFLGLRFGNAFSIERVRTDNPLWQPFRIVIVERPGQPIWNVEVVRGVNGNVERVEMAYEPAPPF
jgi:hypothetical protein